LPFINPAWPGCASVTVGVEICACAYCVEGRTAAGTRSCVGSPFGSIADFASVVTAAAPATATPVREFAAVDFAAG
jgi:hypothetical protein